MQILVQGSSQRIKFTKGDVAKLKSAAALICALDRQTHDSDVSAVREHLDAMLGRIDEKGEYKEAVKGEEKPGA